MKKKSKPIHATTDATLTMADIEVLEAIAQEGPDGFLIPAGSEAEMMEWLDCGWKRVPCGKRSCPLCGRVARDREAMIREGKDPDLPENAFESVGAGLSEALMMIKKDAEEMGIDITNLEEIDDVPEPDAFPLARNAQEWYEALLRLSERETKRAAPWLLTESSADLFWYAGTYQAKLYRQLCNKWHMDRGHAYGSFDQIYTKGVLEQVSDILRKSFDILLDLCPDLTGAQKSFRALENEAKALSLYGS